jgi:hypothetical protein
MSCRALKRRSGLLRHSGQMTSGSVCAFWREFPIVRLPVFPERSRCSPQDAAYLATTPHTAIPSRTALSHELRSDLREVVPRIA